MEPLLAPTQKRSTPLILGHRGASSQAPENTLIAFRLALELGADGIELDVTLTRDQVPVVIHDDRVDRTTDGHGEISDLTLSQLAALDAGSWKGSSFRGERIPTLAEVLELIFPYRRERLLNIELKTTRGRPPLLETRVYSLLLQKSYLDGVLISSFDPFALLRMRRLAPALPRGLLYSAAQPIYLRRTWLRWLVRPFALHPDQTLVDARLLHFARRNALQVNTWTVDDPGTAKRLADLGVDSIITNEIARLRTALTAPAEGRSLE